MRIINLKICKKILEIPFFKVFTRDYKEETQYREFIKSNIERIKFESNNYEADSIVKTMAKNNIDIKMR